MTAEQSDELMGQILAMYSAYGRGLPYGSEPMARLIGGLFEIALEIEPERMRRAFSGAPRARMSE